MVQEMAPVRVLGALGKMARRKRIFARLRAGASYEEIAGEESVSRERVRRSSPRSCRKGQSTAAPIMRSCNWTVSRP